MLESLQWEWHLQTRVQKTQKREWESGWAEGRE